MRCRRRHEPAVEGDLVGVHAPVADACRWPGPPSCRARRRSWVNSKPWPSPRALGTMNSDRPRWVLDRSGSVRASSMSTSARAANVHQVLTPLMPSPPSAVGGRDLDAGHVGAEVGLGHRHRGHDLAGGQRGSQACFCSSVPPCTAPGSRISGRVMSEPPTPSEPRDSSSVATTMPR